MHGIHTSLPVKRQNWYMGPIGHDVWYSGSLWSATMRSQSVSGRGRKSMDDKVRLCRAEAVSRTPAIGKHAEKKHEAIAKSC